MNVPIMYKIFKWCITKKKCGFLWENYSSFGTKRITSRGDEKDQQKVNEI